MLPIDFLPSFFIKFSHNIIIVPLIILGYIFFDKKLFFRVSLLLFSSILFNYILKNIFQVPLSPSIGKVGYAFPSGHLQSVLVLYGFLWMNIKNSIIRIILPIIMIGVALSLMHFGFHNLKDILGATFVAPFILLGGTYLISKGDKKFLTTLLILNSLFTLIIIIKYPIHSWIWATYYGSIGLFLANRFTILKTIENYKIKIISTLCITLISFILNILFNKLFINSPDFIQEMKWIIICFSLPFIHYYSTQFFSLKKALYL